MAATVQHARTSFKESVNPGGERRASHAFARVEVTPFISGTRRQRADRRDTYISGLVEDPTHSRIGIERLSGPGVGRRQTIRLDGTAGSEGGDPVCTGLSRLQVPTSSSRG